MTAVVASPPSRGRVLVRRRRRRRRLRGDRRLALARPHVWRRAAALLSVEQHPGQCAEDHGGTTPIDAPTAKRAARAALASASTR